ncbi:BAG domain-containing protein Samui [Anopheles maculipalpis]|uniref:BAG domain-containing protein Samui n=1 Tax=Anopheles maculipalpis TaxID=1496333 RepID=UPI0021599F3A|nr:BAG domain-containing protein Samui [Anopheles maculipalpis]
MSSQQEQPQQQQQPTVRHIPIFVEGRSEPLINTAPETRPSQPSSQHHPSAAGMEGPSMEMPDRDEFFKHGTIFDRARDIPVRSSFPGFPFEFKHDSSPSASRTTDPLNANVPRGTSVPRQTPSPSAAHQQQHPQQQWQQPQQKPNAANPQQQQHVPRASQPPTHPEPQPQQQPPAAAGQDQPDSRPKMPTKEDPITKIQKIQKDVLAIFDQVEHFKGGKEGKKDKAYIYLDEMLTQNLLKLDSIDAEDQPQIKSARKEAIKSINTCIAVLEAKAEAGASGSTNASTGSIGNTNASSNGIDATNGTEQSASNTSIPHSSSNSSQQQPNEVSKQ